MKQLIEKWYQRLPFPDKYRDAFYALLDTHKLEPCTVAQYLQSPGDSQQNFLMFLYFCEELQAKYREADIDDSVLYDTLEDLVLWTNTYYSLHGRLGLAEINWLKYHMTFRLFKLGRLQFEMKEHTVGVHVPEGEPLDYERCLQSFSYAEDFFAKHFPAFSYESFVCNSWLLDPCLPPLLEKNSNIAKFQTLFVSEASVVSDAAIRYVFGWDKTRETIGEIVPKSGFAARLKAYVLADGILHSTKGIRMKAK